MSEASFVVGIDLGTTNSALAYADLREGQSRELKTLPIPQWVKAGKVADLPLLPSFLYAAMESDSEEPGLPWPSLGHRVGAFAREQGGLVPSRVIHSAKSWLSHPRVDREAAILPWGERDGSPKLSPLQASSQILSHLREAWDERMAGDDESLSLKHQDVVVTIPASFDEAARTLTLKAANQAGLPRVTLVEEPQAAFYWWIETHQGRWSESLPEGGIVLVCDIGGGTTDLSLIRVSPQVDGPPGFERLAVGRHLLLGGDNVDMALARLVEEGSGRKMDLRQWMQLSTRCRTAKEALLAETGLETFRIQVPGSSSRLVGGSVGFDLSLDALKDLMLNGFLPQIDSGAPPLSKQRSGFVQQGLPYETEPAISRHILAFLKSQSSHGGPDAQRSGVLQPHAILFNGGATRSALVRERLVQVIRGWFEDAPLQSLTNEEPERAVSLGAAYYGLSRQGEGLQIRGGSARAFYVQLGSETQSLLCVLPHGSEEGSQVRVADPRLRARTNESVVFSLRSSSTRVEDAAGDVVSGEEMDILPPLVTTLEFGKSGQKEVLPVELTAELTALGTVSLRCVSVRTPHEWALEFDLSGEGEDLEPQRESRALNQHQVNEANDAIRAVFAGNGDPKQITRILEQILGMPRAEWPLATMRGFWSLLLEVGQERQRTAELEARWFNLAGYCLRPGFGEPGDRVRMKELWREVFSTGVVHTKSSEVWREWWVLWRRVSGGMKAGQQTEILGSVQRFLGGKKLDVARLGRGAPDKAELQELWMAAGSFERVEPASRVKLGRQALKYMTTDALVRYGYWVIGRLGARTPVYAGVEAVLPRKEVEAWVMDLVNRSWKHSEKVAFEMGQMGRLTGDRALDLTDSTREALIDKVRSVSESSRALQLLREVVLLNEEEKGKLLADSVPGGLVWEGEE